MDVWEELIRKCERADGYTLAAPARLRLARMMRSAIEKAMVVGWHKDELLLPDAGTSSVVRAAERVANDDIS